MKYVLAILVLLIPSVGWGQDAVDAIPLSIFKQDYSITRVGGLYVYGKVESIETSLDEVTEQKRIDAITLKDGEFFQKLSLSVSSNRVKRRANLLKQGQDVAFSFNTSVCNIYSNSCYLKDLYFDFNQISRDLPTQERSFSVTVDGYFSQQLLYGPLPLKITGIVSVITPNYNAIVIVGKRHGKEITCRADYNIDAQKAIYKNVNIGDEMTLVGTF